MTNDEKKSLYNNIMNSISKTIRRQINDSDKSLNENISSNNNPYFKKIKNVLKYDFDKLTRMEQFVLYNLTSIMSEDWRKEKNRDYYNKCLRCLLYMIMNGLNPETPESQNKIDECYKILEIGDNQYSDIDWNSPIS